jgi:hypothetical protein
LKFVELSEIKLMIGENIISNATVERKCLSTIKTNYERIFLALITMAVFGCKKTGNNSGSAELNAADTIGIYGKWQWTISYFILSTSPSQDSVITLTLKPDSSYVVGLNGNVFAKGTFQITEQTDSNNGNLHFNNFPQTIIDSTQSETIIQYGVTNFGRLTLFVNQSFHVFNDTIQFLPIPCCAPEVYESIFKKK